MTLIIEPQPVPLRKDPDGTWRVGNTRVLLDLVIHAFNVGRTPEDIIQSYDTSFWLTKPQIELKIGLTKRRNEILDR